MNIPAREKNACTYASNGLRISGFERCGSALTAQLVATAALAGLLLLQLVPNAMAQTQGAPAPGLSAQGQTKPPVVAKPVPPAAPVVKKPEVGPTWQELTPAQQTSLKPLAVAWSGIGEAQKRKWLAVSKNYPALPAPEQAKLHSRMTEWTSLSQQQRTQARLNFAETKKLSPGDKTANWQEYQALSPEDRQKLAAKATPNPAGAAPAVKPVAPLKLATVPALRSDTKHAGNGALGLTGNATVDRNTLLPRPAFTEDPLVRKN